MTAYRTAVQIRWGDLDAYGHVNNAAFLTILEAGRVGFLRGRIDLSDPSSGLVIRKLELEFLRQISLDDSPVEVSVEVEGIGTSSVTVRERIHHRDGSLLADARSVLVHLDRASGASTPIPSALRGALAPHASSGGGPT